MCDARTVRRQSSEGVHIRGTGGERPLGAQGLDSNLTTPSGPAFRTPTRPTGRERPLSGGWTSCHPGIDRVCALVGADVGPGCGTRLAGDASTPVASALGSRSALYPPLNITPNTVGAFAECRASAITRHGFSDGNGALPPHSVPCPDSHASGPLVRCRLSKRNGIIARSPSSRVDFNPAAVTTLWCFGCEWGDAVQPRPFVSEMPAKTPVDNSLENRFH